MSKPHTLVKRKEFLKTPLCEDALCVCDSVIIVPEKFSDSGYSTLSLVCCSNNAPAKRFSCYYDLLEFRGDDWMLDYLKKSKTTRVFRKNQSISVAFDKDTHIVTLYPSLELKTNETVQTASE